MVFAPRVLESEVEYNGDIKATVRVAGYDARLVKGRAVNKTLRHSGYSTAVMASNVDFEAEIVREVNNYMGRKIVDVKVEITGLNGLEV